jgi:tRNA-specific adenosine deaminase 3
MYVALFQDCDAGDTLVHIAVEPNSPLRRRSYLCTGFDCYVVQEPCAMCAMAATHARVRRICYSIVDSEQGMLGGAIRLHGQTSLNHHYQVFHLPVA